MKKNIVLFIFVFASLITPSCKKEYECTCVSVFNGGNYTSYSGVKATKKNAQTWCASLQNSNPQVGVSTTCTIQ